MAPQTSLTPADAAFMKAGGIESVRWPLAWASIQPKPTGGYDWSSFDETVAVAARAGLEVLPSVSTSPTWVSAKPTTLPVRTVRQRAAWAAFLRAAVRRYGPGGEFWREHSKEVVRYEPAGAVYEPAVSQVPIRSWQIWNEPNFFYFAYPVSPRSYAKLVEVGSGAVKGVDPSAKVILAGLFGEPTARGSRGMPAVRFLRRLYSVPGLQSRFDGVSLHPYAYDTTQLEELVEDVHQVSVENHDHVGLYITEMGWGSQNDYNKDAFEQGPGGQVRQLRRAYGYLIANQRRLNLKQVDWFTWKDVQGSCDFCDSVGLFREGARFRPKPAWHAFVRLTGGRARP